MRQRLDAICQRHAGQGFSVRGKGMMQGLDVGNGDLAKRTAARAFETGLLIGACGTGGRVLKLIPPLTIPEADLNEGLDLLDAAIDHGMEKAA
jgi:diaminobutyrate-2-oxoglutarate transaminase